MYDTISHGKNPIMEIYYLQIKITTEVNGLHSRTHQIKQHSHTDGRGICPPGATQCLTQGVGN